MVKTSKNVEKKKMVFSLGTMGRFNWTANCKGRWKMEDVAFGEGEGISV